DRLAGQSGTFSPGAGSRMAGDFQPPYFPPPFTSATPPVEYMTAPGAPDAYAGLNSLHQHHYQIPRRPDPESHVVSDK
ncbi:unnamed protein product, partial [Nesidiocoris tenuis]